MADTSDEIRENRWREKNGIDDVPTEVCDCCNNRSEDYRASFCRGYFVCVGCLKNNEAFEFYYANGHSLEEINNWIESLNLK